MDPRTVQVDVAMTEADRLPMLTISSQSSFVLSATPPSDASFNVASLSSTPPTSVSPDNVSLASDQDVPTPKAMAVSCRILDEPEPQSLLSLGLEGAKELHLEQQPERESELQTEPELKAESEHPLKEPLTSLPPLDEASPKQKPESPSEPLTRTTTEASSELDVQAQLERQLECETELRVESNPESELDAPDVQPPTEQAPEEAAEKEAGQQTEQQPVSGTKHQLQPEPAIEPSASRQLPESTAIVVATESPAPAAETPSPKRSRRARASLPTYNLSKLFGTDIHGRRASKGDDVKSHKRRRTAVGLAPAANDVTASAPTEDDSNVDATALVEALGETISALDALQPSLSPARLKHATKSKLESKKEEPQAKIEIATRRATRLSGASVPSAVVLPLPLTSLRKRGKKAVEAGLSRCKRELLRLQDTKEFAHVDEGPTITTVWSNGKFVDPRTLEEPAEGTRASKRVKTSHATEAEEDPEKAKTEEATITNALPEVLPEPKKRTAKIWLDKGLYAGQKAPVDASACLTTQEKKKLAQVPELTKHSEKPNKTLPAPMFNGLRLLLNGRDFQLPYDICNPLPPGHPKPPTYRTLTKNRFVGEAGQYWKKQKHMDDLPSKCVCKPEDGCAEDCQNRIMLYECDDTNCNVGREQCGNRPFATLTERTQQGGRYRVGVEVFKTGDRGFGVRSNRCFRPHQIIMEYTGEIITEDECLHRMDTVYKNNEVRLFAPLGEGTNLTNAS
jgi:histone-lysine N-methyltransferase ASH1L